jgi:hypothetical protein
MTGESRLADLQRVYQLTHAQFPAPESSNNADACRIYDSLPKGGKVSHYLLYIGIYRYIKRNVNHEKKAMLIIWKFKQNNFPIWEYRSVARPREVPLGESPLGLQGRGNGGVAPIVKQSPDRLGTLSLLTRSKISWPTAR